MLKPHNLLKPKMTQPSFKEEQLLWSKGFINIAGVDEVGRGAFAGPIVAASVILPSNFAIKGINDSKKLTPKQREELSKYIFDKAICVAIAEVGVDTINAVGIGKANQIALNNSLQKLKEKFQFALIDGFIIKDLDLNLQKAIIKGDSISVSIAAASIVAKVYRDKLMEKLHLDFPEYNFFENKGYGTKFHQEALKKYGLSKLHRTSFNLSRFL